MRGKFDAGPYALRLAARLLIAADLKELPQMIRPVTIAELAGFFEERARELARAE